MLNASHYHATETLMMISLAQFNAMSVPSHSSIGTAMLKHLCSIARQAGLKHFYALAISDNEGAPRLLNKLGFRCDIRRDPAQRMMHITVHLNEPAPTEGLRTTKETDMAGKR